MDVTTCQFVPSLATTVTEVVTGLGTVGHDDLAAALAARPAELRNVSHADWDLLDAAFAGGGQAEAFASAWENGRAFLAAAEGLRHRTPRLVEWKGSTRTAGDDALPVDLRIDHVYLVSCKYLSRILLNVSPVHLFDRLLGGGHGRRSGTDWFAETAPGPYQRLYELALAGAPAAQLPRRVGELTPPQRRWLAEHLGGTLSPAATEVYHELSARVAAATAERWRQALDAAGERQALLWRLLRIHSAPYFVLGSSKRGPMRLRIATPWDWRQRFELRSFAVDAQPGGQPRVGWSVVVRDRYRGADVEVAGHVEIRWSHGRFSGPPEAKVYLDTPHEHVPGYEVLR